MFARYEQVFQFSVYGIFWNWKGPSTSLAPPPSPPWPQRFSIDQQERHIQHRGPGIPSLSHPSPTTKGCMCSSKHSLYFVVYNWFFGFKLHVWFWNYPFLNLLLSYWDNQLQKFCGKTVCGFPLCNAIAARQKRVATNSLYQPSFSEKFLTDCLFLFNLIVGFLESWTFEGNSCGKHCKRIIGT